MINPPSVKYAIYEMSTILRHPEQLLLIIGTPIALLVLFPQQPHIFEFTLASCSLASSFTSLAINTAFARRYGTLKYLAVTPLGLRGVVIGQSLVGILLLVVQMPIVVFASVALDTAIHLNASVVISLPLLVMLFTQAAFLFASVLSAEKVLAFANLFFLIFLMSGLRLMNSDLSFLHPLSGVTTLDKGVLPYLLYLLVLNAGVYLSLRKYFKWLD
jgi:ABC-2 type transport system permease protein